MHVPSDWKNFALGVARLPLQANWRDQSGFRRIFQEKIVRSIASRQNCFLNFIIREESMSYNTTTTRTISQRPAMWRTERRLTAH